MERFRRQEVCEEAVAVAGKTYRLLVPRGHDALLEDARVAARFEEDEYLPYWATLWPSARLLAHVVAQWPRIEADAGLTVLEIGCGVGLVGLVAAKRGNRVILSDYDEDALTLAVENCRRNGVIDIEARRVDWREMYADLRVDRILAADVLYESRNLEPVARFVAAHLKPRGEALVADPNRGMADRFADVARAAGLAVEVEMRPGADDAALPKTGRVYHLRRG